MRTEEEVSEACRRFLAWINSGQLDETHMVSYLGVLAGMCWAMGVDGPSGAQNPVTTAMEHWDRWEDAERRKRVRESN